MGFSAGFSVIKRIHNCTFIEMIEAKRHADFENSTWLKQTYKSYKDYVNTNLIGEKLVLITAPETLVKEYMQIKPINICDWCSNARSFDENIISLSEYNYEEYYKIGHESLEKLYEYAKQAMADLEIIPVTITHGIKTLENDTDEAEYKLIPIDGVQIQLEDGSIRQIISEYDDGVIFVSKSLADFEKIYTFKSLLECVEQLKQYNLDEYFIYYWRSY